jgi:TPR repeat protein
MMRLRFAVLCSAALLLPAHGARADAAFDQDMASHYLRAAQGGDDEAQFYIGSLYSAGVGVPHSDQEAFRWFGRAANQGHSHAMLIVAGLYATARGVSKNNIEAYKWAYIVNGGSRVEQYRDDSRQLMNLLETRMSPQDISLAKAAAGSWRATVTSRPVPTTSPAAEYSRTTPVASAAAAPTPQPSKAPSKDASSNDNPLDAYSKYVSKSDVDDFLRELPAMRKRFGF